MLNCDFNMDQNNRDPYNNMWRTEAWLTIAVQKLIPGDNGDPGTSLAQATDLVVFYATVYGSDSHCSLWIKNFWFLLA